MRILVASKIDKDALATLQATHDVVTAVGASRPELEHLMADREALVFRSGLDIDRALLDAAPRLRTIVRAGSGLDNLDLAEVHARGIHLQRIPGPGARAVAEMTFALFLGLARQVVLVDRLLREGHWAKNEVTGWNLGGKTLGVVGLGSIGSTVARLGAGWEMRVIGCVSRPDAEREAGFATQGIELLSLDEVLKRSDFLSIHVPLGPETRGLIGRAELARMKPGSILVNIARGGVVDEAALLDALTAGERPAAAGLDVHVAEGEGKISPLAALPNVIVTPHIGATTVDAQREIGVEIVRIIEDRARSASEEPMPTVQAAVR
jgi:D-3-phosphoglycerate dehydrogenase